ncbi:MAG: DNA translocase FtsK 4TM domain-containing protein [Clostridia bacterium]|nr:DNA translocase FtsK 4TM domain-containing protein [Clostridia bacterium]
MRKNTKAKNTNSTTKSKNTKPKTNKKTSASKEGKNFEIFSICIAAFCLYLLICIYSKGESGGFVGKLINSAITGVMGTCAYILPIMTIALLIYALFFAKEGQAKKKCIYSYSLLFVLTGLFQLIYSPKIYVVEWFSYGISGKPCGGFLGAFLLTALRTLGGDDGACIIMIAATLVLLILLFDISFVAVVKWIKEKIQNAAKEAKQKDADKKHATKGVAVKPDLDNNNKKSSENDIVINVPEEDDFEYFEDPEIKVYDDVVSGPEDEEPSEEEKAAKRLSGEETETMTREIQEEIESKEDAKDKLIEYTYPNVDLLAKPQPNTSGTNVQEELKNNARQLIETLRSFKVDAKVVEISQGPTITRYEIEPAEGIRVNQITNLSKDIGLRFKADKGVMVAPVPGKSTIGIEIENKDPSVVTLREVIESEEFKNHKSKLAVALGKDVSGKPIIMDLAKMPHLLIAGATGAGKSVCINTLIVSLMYKADPNEVKLVMIDPKQVELGVYNGIPHLLIPVVKDAKKATGALSWAVQEMTERYSIFERNNVRNIKGYNELMEKNGTPENKMASIVIIIDEFADLMMVAPADVENYVCRIAQLARAAGMHLVIATQRPVVKFITGNIKANVPSRISFMVASVRDSQTILDMGGAEKLIGKGDMLYMPVGETSPSRMQCAFVSDDDVKAVVEAVSKDAQAVYDVNVIEQLEKDEGEYQPDGEDPGDADELLPDAIDMAITSGQISTSLLQRRFRIGYNRAGSIIDQMEARGIISGLDGNKPRQVLISREEYNEMLMK